MSHFLPTRQAYIYKSFASRDSYRKDFCFQPTLSLSFVDGKFVCLFVLYLDNRFSFDSLKQTISETLSVSHQQKILKNTPVGLSKLQFKNYKNYLTWNYASLIWHT